MQERAMEMRGEIWTRVTVVYDDGKFTTPGYQSPISKKRRSQMHGFLVPNDCVVRIPKTCGFVSEINKSMRSIWPDGTAFDLSIVEIPIHPVSMEWALGCKGDL
jgi:hypothetical protein